MELIIHFTITIVVFAAVSMSAVIPPLNLAALPIVLVDQTTNTENSNDQEIEAPIDYETALKLYTMAEETSQSIEGIYVAYFSGFQSNPEYLYQYCYYNPLQNNIEGCNTESVLGDLKLLIKIASLYDSVVNYEATNGQAGYIAVEQMKETQTKLNNLIDYIKQSFQTEGSGVQNENNNVYYNIANTNTTPSQCYQCSSVSDQYSIIMEMKVIIGLTVNHSNCIKENVNPNNSDDN